MKFNFSRINAPRRFNIIAGLLVIILSLLLFSGPIADIDFWWHISNGRWIWTHHALPVNDPDSIYPTVNHWARTVLQGQWGGQLLLFLIYDHLGSTGIVFFRIVVLGAALMLLALRLRQTGAPQFVQLTGIVAVAVVLSGFAVDRPQLLSILFFSLLAVVLDMAHRRRLWQFAVVPLLVIWTNLHQGVLLGALVSVIQLLIFTWNDYRAGKRQTAWQSLLIAILALFSPLATPNGTNGIEYVIWLEFLPAKQRISEYASSISYLPQVLSTPHLLVFFTFAGAILLAAIKPLRESPLQCVLPLLLVFLAIFGYRYIPFALIGGIPFLAVHLPRLTLNRIGQGGMAIALSALIGVAAFQMMAFRAPSIMNAGVSAETMPVALTERAAALGMSGKVFTTVGWGGFLSWRLADQGHPFIDGRFIMDLERLDDYTHMLWATERGQELFSAAQFDWVLMPHRSAIAYTDPPYPLVSQLNESPDWQLRMETAQGVLFSRKMRPSNMWPNQ